MARALFALAFVAFWCAFGRDSWDGWVERTILPATLAETSVEVRDRNGAVLRIFPVENGRVRLPVRVQDVDPRFVEMLIAYEDKRFWTHSGVDGRAGVRAALQAVWNGTVVSGGSTLSMQVARLLENSGTGRWAGKLRQMRVAWALERRLDKAQILELYLLHAPYGGPLEGVRAASLAWFGKEPHRLTEAEAALLVALPQAPESRRPDRQTRAALRARDRVLARLNLPSAAQPMPRQMQGFARLAPHLGDELRRADPLRQRHSVTLDRALQIKVEALARTAIRGQAAGVSVAVVVADHQTGAVLASSGAPAYSAANGALGFVDMTRAKRSPGSTLKPLIYGLAFDQGLAHPETIFNDTPTVFGRYAPQNFDGVFRGEVTARAALQMSLNIAPVMLTDALGPRQVMARLRASGAEPVLPDNAAPGLAIALGGVGLSLRDLVQLYAGLAQGGQARPLVWQSGERPVEPAQIMSARSAWYVSHILGGLAPPPSASKGQLAYKTGTSYGHRDAWAVGFDGQHVVGVWMGRPDGTPVPGAFGGDLAAPVMFEVFGRIKDGFESLPPPPADALMVPTDRLPQPLQYFGKRRDQVARDGLRVAFPPDGAALVESGGVPLKLRGGRAPFTVLVNNAPHRTGLRQRDVVLEVDAQGFHRISVIDATGQSQSVNIQIN
jgi:penicillin-binding protein 1C